MSSTTNTHNANVNPFSLLFSSDWLFVKQPKLPALPKHILSFWYRWSRLRTNRPNFQLRVSNLEVICLWKLIKTSLAVDPIYVIWKFSSERVKKQSFFEFLRIEGHITPLLAQLEEHSTVETSCYNISKLNFNCGNHHIPCPRTTESLTNIMEAFHSSSVSPNY